MAIQAQLYPENMGFPLCGSQDWSILDNSGCSLNYDLGFNRKQQQQQQQLMLQLENQQFHKNQFISLDNSFLHHPSCKIIPPTSSSATVITNNNTGNLFSMSSIAAHFEKQRQEMDAYITLQNETLKLAFQHQAKRQYASLMNAIEARAAAILRHKEEEIARASKRTVELDDFVSKLETENRLWKRAAAENEAMIISLNSTLEQLRVKQSCLASNVAEDAGSCCCVDEEEEAWQKKNRLGGRGEDVEREKETSAGAMMMLCRRCNTRKSSVLFFPCRHLCSCRDCEAFLDACPACKTAKQATIEALFS